MPAIQRIKPYEAKKALTTVINRVAIGKEPIIFESRGKDLAVLISMEQFELLEELLEEQEDRIAIEESEKALADPENQGERIPWERIRDELGL